MVQYGVLELGGVVTVTCVLYAELNVRQVIVVAAEAGSVHPNEAGSFAGDICAEAEKAPDVKHTNAEHIKRPVRRFMRSPSRQFSMGLGHPRLTTDRLLRIDFN